MSCHVTYQLLEGRDSAINGIGFNLKLIKSWRCNWPVGTHLNLINNFNADLILSNLYNEHVKVFQVEAM
jgi:hypothetical protein